MEQYIFEWDLRKERANIRKHGISFELAQTIFEDPDVVFNRIGSLKEKSAGKRWAKLRNRL